MRERLFRFKQFSVSHSASAMKVGTDGVTLGAWAACAGRVLDVGCGCGLIGLMCAQRGASEVTMVEIDPAAAQEAAQNAAKSPWADRVTTVCDDFLTAPLQGDFDAIVSNPPFFANGELAPDRRRADARHESGLTPDAFMARAAELLAPDGTVSVILPPDRAEEWTAAATFHGLRQRRLARLYTGAAEPRRVLVEFGAPSSLEVSELHINSPEYQEIVKDFYLNP